MGRPTQPRCGQAALHGGDETRAATAEKQRARAGALCSASALMGPRSGVKGLSVMFSHPYSSTLVEGSLSLELLLICH